VNTARVLVVDSAFMAAARRLADLREPCAAGVERLLRGDGPLTPGDRQALLTALARSARARTLADQRVRDIAARLDRS
jgi:hypothetical protein